MIALLIRLSLVAVALMRAIHWMLSRERAGTLRVAVSINSVASKRALRRAMTLIDNVGQ